MQYLPNGAEKGKLPATKMSTGDIVGVVTLQDGRPKTLASGIVVETAQKAINVAFDDTGDLDDAALPDGHLALVKLANDVTYQRMKS